MGLKDVLILPSKENAHILKHVKRNLISKSDNEKEGLSVGNLITLIQNGFFSEHGHIHEFLENSDVHLITTPVKPRNPELEARVQKLKAEQDNEEYRRMTKGLGGSIQGKQQAASLKTDVKLVTSQITAVVNFVLSVGGSFFFAFKAVEYALPEENIPAQVLMGIITSTVVALADLYFLARTI